MQTSHVKLLQACNNSLMEGMESALGRKVQEKCRRVTGDIKAWICAIACLGPTQGAFRWTMQAIADVLELYQRLYGHPVSMGGEDSP